MWWFLIWFLELNTNKKMFDMQRVWTSFAFKKYLKSFFFNFFCFKILKFKISIKFHHHQLLATWRLFWNQIGEFVLIRTKKSRLNIKFKWLEKVKEFKCQTSGEDPLLKPNHSIDVFRQMDFVNLSSSNSEERDYK